jgi:hypothetical protein
MSHGVQHDKKPSAFRKRERVDPYHAKIVKTRSKQRREDSLRHAVRHNDEEALELYEEPDYD